MLKSPSGMDLTGLAIITAGSVPQGISNQSLAHSTNVPWLEEPWDPSAGPPRWDMPVSGEIQGPGALVFWGCLC